MSEWRYWAARAEPFRAMVFRNANDDGTLFDIVGINDIPAGPIRQAVTYQVPENERIVVRKGDVIAFGWESLPVVEHGHAVDEQIPLLYKADYPINSASVNDQLSVGTTTLTRVYSIQAIVAGN